MAGADEGLRNYSTPESEWHWRFLVLKGEILARQRLMHESLELIGGDLPPFLVKSDIAVRREMTVAYLNGFLGNLNLSERLFGEAEQLATANHPELLGEVALRKGTVALFVRQDSKSAESLFLATLNIARKQKDTYLEANALGSMGLAATKQEHYDEAIDWFRTALQLSRVAGARSVVAKTTGNLGWGYFEIGDYENARELFQQAEEASEKVGLSGDQVYWQTNTGVVDYFLGDYPSAERETRKALALARKMEEKQGIVQCLNNLGEIALKGSDLDLATKVNQEALQIVRSADNHPEELSTLLIAGKIELARKQYPRAAEILAKVIQSPAAATAIRWEAEARLAKVFDEEGNAAKAEREYRRSIDTIEAARHSVGQDELRLTFLSSAVEFYDDYIDFLVAHGRADAALQVAERSRATTLTEGLSQTRESGSAGTSLTDSRRLAKSLHATLFFYWLGESHSYLWAITSAKIQKFQLPPSGQIEPLVKSYRLAQAEGRDVLATSEANGQKLYELLVAPAQKLIPANSRVILLPDASLYSLNFETLIVPSPQPHFWIEDATLSTANSLTLLGAAASRVAHEEKNLLLVGDTVQASPEFPSLRQAPQEISLLEKYFPESRRAELVKDKATATAYLSSNAERYAYLHFVTHGTASRTRPLESAVVLSKEPGMETFKLYARDIVQHHLNAELVTISACNGSGTRAYSGEGLVGLSWAFLRAGAHNVIGALWEVSDASTPQLMDTLYGGLSRGQDPATALRNAKLSLLHSDSAYKKPYYWAPFQLYTGS